MASDSRSNAGFDQVNTCRKMYRFVEEGERIFVILTSGSLSISQSVVSLLRVDFDAGRGLAQANSLYQAARIVGDCVRQVSEIDRASLERDSFSFNVNLLLGGQVRGEAPGLYLIYPQGNPLQATEDSPYLQLGECKYGRPILDRGIDAATSLEVAAKYAAVVRRDDAIERHRGAADRSAVVQAGQPGDYAGAPDCGVRSGLEPDSHVVGAGAPARGRAAAGDSVRRSGDAAGRSERASSGHARAVVFRGLLRPGRGHRSTRVAQ